MNRFSINILFPISFLRLKHLYNWILPAHEWGEVLGIIKYLCVFFRCLALIVSHMQYSNKPESCQDIASTQSP